MNELTASRRKISDSQLPQAALPYWSDYLARLALQARVSAVTRLRLRSLHGQLKSAPGGLTAMPHYRQRNPRGDRRMSVEQRSIAVTQSLNSPLSLPYWSAYLRRLGEEVKRASRTRNLKRALLKNASLEDTQSHPVRCPIGDRRTRLRSRRRTPAESRFSLGGWQYYFVAKLVLYGMALIAFHPLANLAFAAFLLWRGASPRLGRLQNIAAMPMALALLYYDSWLPPIQRLIFQASALSQFNGAYLLELLARFASWSALAALLIATLVCRLVSRWLHLGALLIVGMALVGVAQGVARWNAGEPTNLDQGVAQFFTQEADRSVKFEQPLSGEVPFDVIFIHVCSLSWDDVEAVGLAQHPLWKQFDILLTRFNSAASYSGPAALHLLRANCGQPEHGRMYVSAAEKCYLMSSLQRSGFEPELALNHDGQFDDFIGQIRTHGHLNAAPLSLDGLEVAQRAFDGTPVYDDLSVLDRWLDKRRQSDYKRVALYYNTVTMHDGNYLPGAHSSQNTQDIYKGRLRLFLDETAAFMQKLQQSGHRAVVVFVPEHGAAVRGDAMQIAGLRELPTPAITLVPVGIKVVGEDIARAEKTLRVDQPTSYLAISHIIAQMLDFSPFAGRSFKASEYIENLPTTRFVAQNEKTVMMESNQQYFFTHGTDGWQNYSEFNALDTK